MKGLDTKSNIAIFKLRNPLYNLYCVLYFHLGMCTGIFKPLLKLNTGL